MKKNPLKNFKTLLKHNPYSKTANRMSFFTEVQCVKAKKEKFDKRESSSLRPIKKEFKRASMKKNPLKNLKTLLKLNPYAKTAKTMSLLVEAPRVKAKKEKFEKKRKPITKKEASTNQGCWQSMVSDHDLGLILYRI